ncbi:MULTISPECIES: carboxylesterase/lipase family protein [Hungatella]|uniref:carboxylesterase/lipase family protein n=1 Tax=Hungatella TaxID=1649459 RepID=UPI0011DE0879|nr:carboxylesterase family protein [Hungatella hathewayi]
MIPKKLSETIVCRPDYPVACTKKGKIRGILSESTFIFKGIPYASARRFHKAEELPPWEGIKDALYYGYTAPQLVHTIAADERFIPHYYTVEDENCHYMNIWTQSLDHGSKLPVMVWFHGGGWKNGSSVEQFAYDGEMISKTCGLVFVTFNNRQNCFGALDLSSFGKEYEDSVMAGLSDVVAAMRWIQDNIGAFGGDPGNVTVVGQAGGAKRVLALMQTPEADGLYHKAAVGSCAGECMKVPEGITRKQIARRMGELTVRQLGLDYRTVGAIEKLPYRKIVEAVNSSEKLLKQEIPERFRWEPVADNQYIFEEPFQAGFRRETLKIPMMTGTSFGEMASNARVRTGSGNKNTWSESYTQKLLEEQFGSRARSVAAAFKKAYPGRTVADALFIDRMLRGKLTELSMKRAKAGGKVWNWLFDLESPVDGGTVAWHCSETPFITGNSAYMEASFIAGITEELQEKMMYAWAAFARDGDPGSHGLPAWPQVTEDSVPTMIFGRKSFVRTDHDRDLLHILMEEA